MHNTQAKILPAPAALTGIGDLLSKEMGARINACTDRHGRLQIRAICISLIAMTGKIAVAAMSAVLALCAPCLASARSLSKSPFPDIAIEAAADRRWFVTYTLTAPARALIFDRSPDSSRTRTWTVPPSFELIADARGELVRRRDRAPFTTVTLGVPAAYQELPKDYAPFSPFGDGGMLVHSGRFFACTEACPDNPEWRMSLRAPAGKHVLVNGRRRAGTAAWQDQGDGRNVFVGDATPIETPDVLAIVDKALPVGIRKRLDSDLPRFMRFFAAQLGALPTRPLLFASYDAGHRPGWGRQGGTLPGQVFTHFYGAGWTTEMAKPEFDFDLAWHFAHEAAHLYQRQITASEKGAAWVHEGAAEAFAAIALRRLNPALGPRIDAKIMAARVACDAATGSRSLHAVVEAGGFEAAYSCGLLINMAIHDAALAHQPRSGGLFTIWRSFADIAGSAQAPDFSDFMRAVSRVAGACAAEKVGTAAASAPASKVAAAVQSCRPVLV